MQPLPVTPCLLDTPLDRTILFSGIKDFVGISGHSGDRHRGSWNLGCSSADPRRDPGAALISSWSPGVCLPAHMVGDTGGNDPGFLGVSLIVSML